MSEQADIVTKELVERFLMWQLPKSVCSDLCVTDPKYSYPRSGTNLLTADEARQMVEYLFAPHLESLAILQDDQRKLDRVLQILGIADTDLDAAAYCEQLCQQRDVLGERAEKAESALATAEAAALERAAQDNERLAKHYRRAATLARIAGKETEAAEKDQAAWACDLAASRVRALIPASPSPAPAGETKERILTPEERAKWAVSDETVREIKEIESAQAAAALNAPRIVFGEAPAGEAKVIKALWNLANSVREQDKRHGGLTRSVRDALDALASAQAQREAQP